MRRTPLFTQTARGEPQGYHFLAMALSALLPAVVPAEQMPNYTWHSFRIGLACALRAAQAPGWVLLALLRWRSPSSIPGYGRFSFETAASWLDQVSSQEASSRQATKLPMRSELTLRQKGGFVHQYRTKEEAVSPAETTQSNSTM